MADTELYIFVRSGSVILTWGKEKFVLGKDGFVGMREGKGNEK